MVRRVVLLILIWLAPLAQAQVPLPEEADRNRIAEAFHLADSVQDKVWSGWSEVPFVLLLVTEDYEYLFRHPYPSDDFQSLGIDPVTDEEIFARENTGAYSLGFLATFPAVNGVNTVVIGKAQITGKSSTLWAITALHEHFHQLQFTRPWYYGAVDDLDLSGGDTSGMWQLNYPFPYDSKSVGQAFETLIEVLSPANQRSGCKASEFSAAMKQLRDTLDEADFRYLVFQLWQEGVARYTEYAIAKAAAKFHTPLPEFSGLDDFTPYPEAYESLLAQQREEMMNLSIADWQRVAFYPLGAGLALLQDACSEGWKTRYFEPPYFEQLIFTG